MILIKHPNTLLRGPNEKIEFPLSEENKIIIQNMITLMYLENGIDLCSVTNSPGQDKQPSVCFTFLLFLDNTIGLINT